MDLGSLIGILVGFSLLLWAITDGGSLRQFWQFAGVLITVGGTLAAVMVNYPLGQVLGVLRVVKKAFMTRRRVPGAMIATLVGFAQTARREGLLALENEAEQVEDPFLQRGLMLVVDGTDPELVKSILETEMTLLAERHQSGAAIFQRAGIFAPAFGMIGTLVGLIQMLSQLENPEAIGPGLAVALTTTLYGALLANLVFLPIAGKLKVRSDEEILMREMMTEGILSILAGDNPRILKEKLEAFLPPNQRGIEAAAPEAAAEEVAAGDD